MTSSNVAAEREARLHEILAEYLQAVDAGQRPVRQEFLNRHPELAEELGSFFANQDRADALAGALRPGAGVFLVKATPPAEIINAVRVVATGDAIISPSVTRTLLAHFSDTQASDRRRTAIDRLAKHAAKSGKDRFGHPIRDFYLTYHIARASAIMADLSPLHASLDPPSGTDG